jgi:hypothetical protein
MYTLWNLFVIGHAFFHFKMLYKLFFLSNNCLNILIDCIMRRWREEPNFRVVGGSPCGMGNNTKHKYFKTCKFSMVVCCQNLICISNLLESKKARLLELARYWFWSLAGIFLYHVTWMNALIEDHLAHEKEWIFFVKSMKVGAF